MVSFMDYNPLLFILMLVLSPIWPMATPSNWLLSTCQHGPILLLAIYYFLAQQDTPGSSCVLLDSVLESAVSSRSPTSVLVENGICSQDQDVLIAFGVFLFTSSRWTEQGNYMYTYEYTLYIYSFRSVYFSKHWFILILLDLVRLHMIHSRFFLYFSSNILLWKFPNLEKSGKNSTGNIIYPPHRYYN